MAVWWQRGTPLFVPRSGALVTKLVEASCGWATGGNQADDTYHPSRSTYAHHSRAIPADDCEATSDGLARPAPVQSRFNAIILCLVGPSCTILHRTAALLIFGIVKLIIGRSFEQSDKEVS